MELTQAASKTCRACLEANLVQDVRIARCVKCELLFCTHFASTIDPQYCTECLSDITLTKEVVTKTYTYYNEETDIVTEYKRRARYIKLDGLDWLFAQRKIVALTDNELELAVEYHREILHGMLREREERRIKQLHRYANTPKDAATQSLDSATVTAQTVKRTKTIQSSKAAATASATMQAMLAGGMTAAQLLAMLEKATAKK
jgi:hypothetical protein